MMKYVALILTALGTQSIVMSESLAATMLESQNGHYQVSSDKQWMGHNGIFFQRAVDYTVTNRTTTNSRQVLFHFITWDNLSVSVFCAKRDGEVMGVFVQSNILDGFINRIVLVDSFDKNDPAVIRAFCPRTQNPNIDLNGIGTP